MNGQAPNASLAAARLAYKLYMRSVTGGNVRPQDLEQFLVDVLRVHHDMTGDSPENIASIGEQAINRFEESPR